MNKKTFRNTAITTMAATATVAAVAPAAAADEVQFEDVNQDSPHYNAIMDLVEQGAIDGDNEGNFNPYEDIDRGQVAKILTNVLDLETPQNMDEVLSNYDDVDVNDYYAEEISAVTAANIFGGTDDNQFNTWEGITREQMAKVLVNAYGLNEYDADEVELNKENISEKHVDFVQKLVDLGISENPSDFDAWDNIHRDQFSSFVVRTQEVVAEHAEPTVESVSAINATTVEVQFEGQEELVEVELDEELEDGATTVSFEYDGHTYEDVELAEEFTVEPAVESVSAITTNTVEVTIDEPEEDVFDYTVDVMDNEGNQVEVDPVDVSEGQTEVSFEISNPVEEKDLTGVWTVDGKEYSFTAINQLDAITDAASESPLDELELREALNDAGIENIDNDNIDEYADKIVDANPENLVDVQVAVNEANKSDEEQQSEAEAVSEVVDASNQVQLYNALQNNFDRINQDWVVDYASEDGGNLLSYDEDSDISYDDIQAAVDSVNETNTADVVGNATNSNEISNARTLVNSYLKDSEEGELNVKDEHLDDLKRTEAVIEVNNATTNNTLEQALEDLDELENNLAEKWDNDLFSNDFDFDTVHNDVLPDYLDELNEEEAPSTPGEVQDTIDTVNDKFGGFVFTDNDDDDNNVLEVTSGSSVDNLIVKAVQNDGDRAENFNTDDALSATVAMDELDEDVSGNLNFTDGTASIKVDKALSDLGSTDATITFDYDDNSYKVNADILVTAGDVDATETEKTMNVNIPDDGSFTSGDDITTSFTLTDKEGNTLSNENGTHSAEISVNGETFYKDITFENGSAKVTVPARGTSEGTTVEIGVKGEDFTSQNEFSIEQAAFSELNITDADTNGFTLTPTDGVNDLDIGTKTVNISVEDADGNSVDITGVKADDGVDRTVDYEGNLKVDFSENTNDNAVFTELGLDAGKEYTITTTVDDVTETKTFTAEEDTSEQ